MANAMAGIDTLRLRFHDFEIDSSTCNIQPMAILNVDGSQRHQDTPLYQLRGGHFVNGAKAFLNTDVYRFNISSRGALLQLEIPKLFDVSNAVPATSEQYALFANSFERRLRTDGIYTNFPEAKISRLDACKNAVLTKPLPTYFEVLRSLSGKRMRQADYGDTGVSFRNTRRTVNCYSKYNQIENRVKHGKISEKALSGIDRNDMRFELQAKDKPTVKRLYGFGTVADVSKDYGRINETYKKQIKDTVFRLSPTEGLATYFQTDIELYKFFQETKHRELDEFIRRKGAEYILSRYSESDLREFFYACGLDDKNGKVSNRLRRIRELAADGLVIDTPTASYADVYRELEMRFAV